MVSANGDIMLCVKYFWTILFLLATLLSSISYAQGPIIEVQAILKGSALLPCDIKAPIQDDSATLVLWYKEIEENPIYSFDNRGKMTDIGSHWKDNEIFGSRAFFRTISTPATLSLDNIQQLDEGYYRCRVDYYKSPTRNQKLHLTVIVPPSEPIIVDEMDKELRKTTRPYEEGATMTLTCLTYGGRPKPVVRWWRGETLLESKTISISNNVTAATLVVNNLNRSHFRTTYTCQAVNNNVTVPAYQTISVNMYLKPLKVQINKNQQLSAGNQYSIECQSTGSVPPTKISWRKNNIHLPGPSTTISPDGNITTSTLIFTPTMEDNNKTLACIATNPVMKLWQEESLWVLDISYPPIVSLSLGPQLNPDDVEEGDDIYFLCKINSNPLAYKVVWKHNGNHISQNVKNEILTNDNSLVLRNITRKWNGNFTCTASNVEGDKESNTVQLKVLYKPICKSNQKVMYGAAKDEDVQIICEVDSNPEPDSFKWSFNHSNEVIPETQYNVIDKRRGISILTFTPKTDSDFGFLECSAQNRLGKQFTPCIFNIIRASHPQQPNNCTVDNVTTVSLEVNCLEGFDGGLSQQFILEVSNISTGIQLLNLTSNFPSFKLNRLSPGNSIKMNIYAENSKGRSTPLSLEGSTLKAEKRTGSPKSFALTPMIGVFACISILVTVFLIWLIKCGTMSGKGTRKRPNKLSIKELSTPRTALLQAHEKDDKNPDLIPIGKNSGYQVLRTDSQTLDDELINVTNNSPLAERSRNSRDFDNMTPVMNSSPQISDSSGNIGNFEVRREVKFPSNSNLSNDNS